MISSLYKGLIFPAKRLLITRRVEAVAFFVIKADTKMLVSITAYTIALFS